MKETAVTKAPILVVDLTKAEHKAMIKALTNRGSLQTMAQATGVHRDTLTRVKLTGRGETKTVNAIREYLRSPRKAAALQAKVA